MNRTANCNTRGRADIRNVCCALLLTVSVGLLGCRTPVHILVSRNDSDITSKEHVRVSNDVLQDLGAGAMVGNQVRIAIPENENRLALFTIIGDNIPGPGRAEMNQDGMNRLRKSAEFEAVAKIPAINNSFFFYPTDDKIEDRGEFVERVQQPENPAYRVILLAPHGGQIEPHTDEQASCVQEGLAHWGMDASAWIGKGFGEPYDGTEPPADRQDAYTRWHITSTDINPSSFPQLNLLHLHTYTRAVSFHGHSGIGANVVIGGATNLRNDVLKCRFAREIIREVSGLTVTVVANVAEAQNASECAGITLVPEHPFGGVDDANIVNRLTEDGQSGIQIEQTPGARMHWKNIAEAVAEVLLEDHWLCPPLCFKPPPCPDR